MSGERKPAVLCEKNVFAVRLTSLMTEHGETQKELSDTLGVKQQTISYYRHGQSLPDVERLTKIAQYYNVSTDWLLGLSAVSSVDADIRAISKLTGLSQAAIQAIIKRRKSRAISKAQDFLIADDRFIICIANYFLSDVTIKSRAGSLKRIPLKNGTLSPKIMASVMFARIIAELPLMREKFEETIESDSATLNAAVIEYLNKQADLHECQRMLYEIYGTDDEMQEPPENIEEETLFDEGDCVIDSDRDFLAEWEASAIEEKRIISAFLALREHPDDQNLINILFPDDNGGD